MRKFFTVLFASLSLLCLSEANAWAAAVEPVVFGSSDFSGQGTGGSGSPVSASKSGVTFACDKGYGDSYGVRCYSGGTVQITASEQTIEKIAFVFGTANGKTYNGGLDTLITVKSKEWKVTLTSQARMNKITVYLTDDEPDPGILPVDLPDVGNGRLRICAQNLQNYYFHYDESSRPTYGDQAGFAEKTRKIVQAMLAVDADIYAFCEVEGQEMVVNQLADSMNAYSDTPVYAAVNDGINNDNDPTYDNNLKSCFIYRTDRVKPSGTNTPASTAQYYRYVMRIQAFEELSSGEKLVLSMNHFKAKDSSEDQGNSQRETNATQLVNALKSVTSDPDILILGDLNCQVGESPLTIITEAGFEEQLLKYDANAFTHCYNGGELIDHVFANSTMAGQITGAGVFHISTSCGTDASSNFNYRYSDHDPYVVAINLQKDTVTPQPTVDTLTCATAAAQAKAGSTATVYVKGYVTAIQTAYSSQYNNVSFWMADTKDGGRVFEAFRAACTSEDAAPKVGDLVVAHGKLTVYGSTAEFEAGCTYEIIPDEPQPGNGITVQANVTDVGWTEVYLYAWLTDFNDVFIKEVQETGSWPGKKVSKDAETGWWTYTFSQEFTDKLHIIWNNGNVTTGAAQTVDIDGVSENTCYAVLDEAVSYNHYSYDITDCPTPGDTIPVTPTVDTLTCAAAATQAKAGSTATVYVKGYVTAIQTAYSSQYNNVSFWMADTKDGGRVFEAFRAACASEDAAPKVGDLVVAHGKLTVYGNTAEFEAGCTYEIIADEPQPTTYTLTVTAGQGGRVNAVSGTYAEGTTVQLVATPNTGYIFLQWSDGNTTNPRSIVMTKDITLQAQFVEEHVEKYAVRVVALAGGKVNNLEKEYAQGATITLTATANSGYRFHSWSDGKEDNPRSLTVNAPINLFAVFLPEYQLKVSAGQGGTVNSTVNGKYTEVFCVDIEATANTGWEFVRWNDNVTDNPRTVIMNKSWTLSAVFNQKQGLDDIESGISIWDGGHSIRVHCTDAQTISIYTAAGKLLTTCRDIMDANIPVATGMYLVRTNNQSYKIIVK